MTFRINEVGHQVTFVIRRRNGNFVSVKEVTSIIRCEELCCCFRRNWRVFRNTHFHVRHKVITRIERKRRMKGIFNSCHGAQITWCRTIGTGFSITISGISHAVIASVRNGFNQFSSICSTRYSHDDIRQGSSIFREVHTTALNGYHFTKVNIGQVTFRG